MSALFEFAQRSFARAKSPMAHTHCVVVGAVYAHDNPMALGVIQAIEAVGIKPGEDVLARALIATRTF